MPLNSIKTGVYSLKGPNNTMSANHTEAYYDRVNAIAERIENTYVNVWDNGYGFNDSEWRSEKYRQLYLKLVTILEASPDA